MSLFLGPNSFVCADLTFRKKYRSMEIGGYLKIHINSLIMERISTIRNINLDTIKSTTGGGANEAI